MAESAAPESDTFIPLRSIGIGFSVLGCIFVAGGLFTWLIGFRLNYVEYSGLLAGLAFMLPGLTFVGIGRLMSAVAIIGDMARETLLRAERLVAEAKSKARPNE